MFLTLLISFNFSSQSAGYPVAPAVMDEQNTVVVDFPIHVGEGCETDKTKINDFFVWFFCRYAIYIYIYII